MKRNSSFIFLTYVLEDLGSPGVLRFEPQKYHSSSIKFLGKRTGSRPTMMARTTDPYTELFSAAFLVSTSHIEVNTRCRLNQGGLTNTAHWKTTNGMTYVLYAPSSDKTGYLRLIYGVIYHKEVHNSISSVVVFQRWWVLKSKMAKNQHTPKEKKN